LSRLISLNRSLTEVKCQSTEDARASKYFGCGEAMISGLKSPPAVARNEEAAGFVQRALHRAIDFQAEMQPSPQYIGGSRNTGSSLSLATGASRRSASRLPVAVTESGGCGVLEHLLAVQEDCHCERWRALGRVTKPRGVPAMKAVPESEKRRSCARLPDRCRNKELKRLACSRKPN